MSALKTILSNQLNLPYNISLRILYRVLFFFHIAVSFVPAQSNHETRGVWIGTNYRLDWPPPTFDAAKQKEDLEKIFTDIRNRNFNTVYFQVRSGGSVLFHSSMEPISGYLTGSAEIPPEYDPLNFAIKEAHKRQLEIHAWINVFNITPDMKGSPPSASNHLMNIHPNWIVKNRTDGTDKYWLDPGLPEVRNYLINLIAELVEKYNLDGIALDYLRYPSSNFNDDFSYTIYGYGKNRNDWRRDNINTFLDSLYNKLKGINRLLKIGCAPLGVYQSNKGKHLSARDDVFQDALYFLKNKIVDYIAPQIYWSINFEPSFKDLTKFWTSNSFGRNVVINIGAYKPEVKRELFTQINTARNAEAAGIAIYRYSNIEQNKNISFNDFVFPKEMYWLDDFQPEAPKNLRTKITNADPLRIIFSWETVDSPNEIALYKFVKNKPELIALIPGNKKSIGIEIKNPASKEYLFALKSLSKLRNESRSFSNKVIVNKAKIKSTL